MVPWIAIAIDGPAGGGKGTIAQRLAEALGFLYVDTGAMYRAVAWQALQQGIPLEDEKAVSALAQGMSIHFQWRNETSETRYRIFANGEDITEVIRRPEVDQGSSIVAQYPEVRRVLVEKQRQLAQEHHVVMEGRDITTVVLPQATVKLFVTASLEERARRRYEQRRAMGLSSDLITIESDLAQRDKRDSERATSPMRIPEDAIVIDTTGQRGEESAAMAERVIRGILEQKGGPC